MLEIDDLWVNIDDQEGLKGINLRVPVGETHIQLMVIHVILNGAPRSEESRRH